MPGSLEFTQWSALQMTSACLKPFCGLVLIVLAAVLLIKELLLPTNQARGRKSGKEGSGRILPEPSPRGFCLAPHSDCLALTHRPQGPTQKGSEGDPAFVEVAKGQV